MYINVPSEPPFPENPRASQLISPSDTGIVPPDTGVNVEVIGEGITSEGTYHLSADSEIIDLVKRAGGLKPGAVTSGIHWHQKLYDGLTLTIPTREVFRRVRSGTSTLTNRDLIRFRAYGNENDTSARDESEVLNLNEASQLQLEQLPGIGSVLANRIIDYRKKNNGFERVRDIQNIFGIGDVTYQELRAKVTVD